MAILHDITDFDQDVTVDETRHRSESRYCTDDTMTPFSERTTSFRCDAMRFNEIIICCSRHYCVPTRRSKSVQPINISSMNLILNHGTQNDSYQSSSSSLTMMLPDLIFQLQLCPSDITKAPAELACMASPSPLKSLEIVQSRDSWHLPGQKCLLESNNADTGQTRVSEGRLTKPHISSDSTIDGAARHKTRVTPLPASIALYTFSTVTLIVGGPESPAHAPTGVPFHVHKQLLTGQSRFFRAAFGGEEDSTPTTFFWKEKRSRVMALPEDRVEDIGWLVKWLYRVHSAHELYDQSSIDELRSTALRRPDIDDSVSKYQSWKVSLLTDPQGPREGVRPSRPPPPKFGPLIRLYIVADKYAVTNLRVHICNKVIDVAHRAKCVPNREDVAMLWDMVLTEGGDINDKTLMTSNKVVDHDNRAQPDNHDNKAIEGGNSASLKSTILDLYVGLNVRSLNNLIVGRDEWHAGFLKDLVLRMFFLRSLEVEKARGRNGGIKKGGRQG